MYKVLIVDDEEWIRDGLKTFVDWELMGFTVAGEAEDGNQAYKLVTELNPDVVLTDIRMPFCSGIEFMEKVRMLNNKVKFVILSGYDEFEYANAAINFGAFGYLLKPIIVDKLKSVFGRLKQEFDLLISEDLKRKQTFKLLREEFVTKLVHGKPEIMKFLFDRASEVGVNLRHHTFTVLLIEFDEMNRVVGQYSIDDWELIQYALRNIAEELFQSESEVFFFNWNQPACGLIIARDAQDDQWLYSIAEQLIATTSKLLKLKITVYIGPAVDSAFRIRESFLAALKLTEMKFFCGKNRMISEEVYEALRPDPNSRVSPIHKEQLIALVQHSEITTVETYVCEAFDGITTKEVAIETYAQFMKIAAKIKEKYASLLVHVEIVKEQDYYSLRDMETLEDLKTAVTRTYADIVRRLRVNGLQTQNRMMDELISYLEDHYSEEITLETAAELVHMHPIYVSKWFKKEMGKNFTDYLTEIRISKAKELLGDFSLKIYAISDMVGYNDPKHFSKVFKSAVGVTPKEYRKMVLGYMDDLFEM
ncbi:response regulator [Cohnella soli]|uniref:Response regulator n=1 Tax=Cohnella soli TaxID=425005 RepID=A0ABW0HRZ9_9BACL